MRPQNRAEGFEVSSWIVPTALIAVLVGGFALSAIANRLEFALLGLGTAVAMAWLRSRSASAIPLAAIFAGALLLNAALVGLHEEELRLGLLYYGAPRGLAEPLLWLGAAVLAGAALAGIALRNRSRR